MPRNRATDSYEKITDASDKIKEIVVKANAPKDAPFRSAQLMCMNGLIKAETMSAIGVHKVNRYDGVEML